MKKLLLLFVALLTGISGAWAADETFEWESYPSGTYSDGAGLCWLGFTTPGTINATYKLNKISVYLGNSATGKTDSYVAIVKNGTAEITTVGNVLNTSDVLAISTESFQPSSNGYKEFTLDNTISLTGGTTYYITFLTSNTPSDGKYNVTTQRICVNTTYGTYAPGVGAYNNGYGKKTTWTPGIKATFTVTPVSTSYTLTDSNGAKYTGTCNSYYGYKLLLTGCDNLTFSSESWSIVDEAYTYSATITFPFPITSNSVTNATYICSFQNKLNGYGGYRYLWHDNGSNGVITNDYDSPADATEATNKYLWVIEPTITNGSITFTIKKASEAKYILCGEYSDGTAISLNASSTQFTYVNAGSTGTCNPINAFKTPSSPTAFYLSINSVNGSNNLAVHSTIHDGISVGFYSTFPSEELVDSYWEWYGITSNLEKAGKVGYPAYDNANASALRTVQTTRANGTYVYSLTNFNDLKTNYAAYYSTADANITKPSAGFYRIKSSSQGTKAPNMYLMGTNTSCTTHSTRAAYDGSAGTSTGSIWYFDKANSKLYNYGNGGYSLVESSSNIGNATTVTTGASILFQKASASEFGALNIQANSRWLYATKDGSYYHTDSGSNQGSSDKGYNFNIEEVTSLPVAIGSTTYATLYAPVALTIPANVQAYYISALSATEATLTEISTTIPANTPVILKAAAEGTYNFAITTSSAFDGTNKLSGTIAAKAFETGQIYTLQRNVADTQTGLFPKAAGTLAGFKAYLLASEIPSGALAKGFTFKFEDVDGISTVQGSGLMVNGPEIFNLAGQRMSRVQKGVNIVNGKKVLVK